MNIPKKKWTSFEEMYNDLKSDGYFKDSLKTSTESSILKLVKDIELAKTSKDFFENLAKFNRKVLKGKIRKIRFNRSDCGNAFILMLDKRKILGDLEEKPKKEEVLYIRGVGYVKFDGMFRGKYELWFGHK